MKIAVVTSRFPYPLEKGDKLRIFYFIRGLAKLYDVHLFCLSEAIPLTKNRLIFEQLGVEVSSYTQPSWRSLLLGSLGLLTNKLPVQISYFLSRSIKKQMNQDLDVFAPDLILCHLPRCAEYVRHRNEAKLLDYMDAFSESYARMSTEKSWLMKTFYSSESNKMRAYEAEISPDFDVKTIISEQDAQLLKAHVGSLNVISNGVNLEYFKPDTECEPEYDLLFVGNLGYEPNIQAIRFLVEQIMPLLNERLDNKLNILIAGARPDQRVLKYQNEQITISPWLDDIRDAYRNARVFIAPIFSGAGQQNKILEALAMKRPCITSSLVSKGIGHGEIPFLLKADNADEFADQVETLLSDRVLRAEIAERGRQFVETYFSWAARVDELSTLILDTIDMKNNPNNL